MFAVSTDRSFDVRDIAKPAARRGSIRRTDVLSREH